jgi:hypothetical protein
MGAFPRRAKVGLEKKPIQFKKVPPASEVFLSEIFPSAVVNTSLTNINVSMCGLKKEDWAIKMAGSKPGHPLRMSVRQSYSAAILAVLMISAQV